MGQNKKNFLVSLFFGESAFGGRSYEKKHCPEKLGPVITKGFPGRTDAKIQICLQTQTSCRLEIGMDDCVAAVTSAVAAYRRRKQRLFFLELLDVEDAKVSREHICSLCNVHRTPVTSSVHIRFCWRSLAQCCLHVTLRPWSCIRVVAQARNDRRPRAVPRHGYK